MSIYKVIAVSSFFIDGVFSPPRVRPHHTFASISPSVVSKQRGCKRAHHRVTSALSKITRETYKKRGRTLKIGLLSSGSTEYSLGQSGIGAHFLLLLLSVS